MGATDNLVQFITDTHYDTLPEAVVSAAKIGIMDGIANMLAGATQPLAAIISAYVRQIGGTAQCSVVGHDMQSNAPLAAFANGVFLTAWISRSRGSRRPMAPQLSCLRP